MNVFSVALLFFSSVALRVLSGMEASLGTDETVWLYLGIQFSALAGGALLCSKRIPLNPLPLWKCALFLFPFLGSAPILEDDHFRYFWEGRVLASGLSPWEHAPASEVLAEIDFPDREKIGFNALSSPYSPGAVGLFSLVAKLDPEWGLLLFQILNFFLLVFGLWRFRLEASSLGTGLLLIFGKEFVQSIHVDLLAFVLAGLAIRELRSSRDSALPGLFLFASTLIKVNALLILSLCLIRSMRMKTSVTTISLVLALVGSGVVNFYSGPLHPGPEGGLWRYLSDWVWNPGLFSLFWFSGEVSAGRLLTDAIWVTGLALLSLLGWEKGHSLEQSFSRIFAFTAFVRPAYNPWYVCWFTLAGAPGFLLFYAVLSPLSYLNHLGLGPDAQLSVSLITHAPFMFGAFWRGIRFDRYSFIFPDSSDTIRSTP